MLLTVTATHDATLTDASDLGYLLHKHPERVQTFDLPFGTATVVYPEVSGQRCTAALLLEIDPVGLVRNGRGTSIAHYVNDRPYAATSLLAVALGRVYRTAMHGRCDSRPELAAAALTLEIAVPAVPGEPGLVEELFAPLGWRVEATTTPLADGLDWGRAPYVDLRLSGRMRLSEALSHLYVLLPVLDGDKHYWVGPDEIDKLVRRGEGWLATHPQQQLIARRYLAGQRSYVEDATARLIALDEAAEPSTVTDERGCTLADDARESRTSLRKARLETVLRVLREVGAQRVVDMGCGEGHYLDALLSDPGFTEVVGVDVSPGVLAVAERRLRLDRMPERQRARLTLRQSSVTYVDPQLAGYDAMLLVEVVEHVDPERLQALERAVFGAAAPRSVIVTTPNAAYNVHYGLSDGELRHPDHRFEWTRAEFVTWADAVGAAHGYTVTYRDIGEITDAGEEAAAPTSLALFIRREAL